MRSIAAIIVVLAASCAFASAGKKGLRLLTDTEAKLDFVSQYQHEPGFEFLRLTRSPRSISHEVLVPADRLETFEANLSEHDIEHEVVIDDLDEVIDTQLALQREALANRKSSKDILAAFPRYDEIQEYLRNLAKTRSDVVELVTIGKSFEGREILAVKIGGSGRSKPAVVIDAGIHAREWIAPTTAIYAIKQLAENATNRYLLENVDVYVIPSLNPDGYEYTHQSKSTRMWRKTRSINKNSDCLGADGNRNYDYYWMTVGASDNPCSDTYAGSKPFSEPETAALRDFMLNIENIKVYLSFHSYGQYMLYPWSYTTEPPKNEPELKCAGERAELALSKVRGTRYEVGLSTVLMYPSAGSSDDWSMGVAGAKLAYTIELPGGYWGFEAPPSEILPVGQETFEALKVFIDYAEDKICQNVAHS